MKRTMSIHFASNSFFLLSFPNYFQAMKSLVVLILLSVSLTGFSQNETASMHQVFLKNGSVLYGSLIENSDSNSVTVISREGVEFQIPDSLFLYARPSGNLKVIFSDGRQVAEKGRYATLSVHTLTASRTNENDNALRWGMGAHYSTGYRFSPALGLGGGMGIDMHQHFFAPVFVEISGFLVKNEFRTNKKSRPTRKNDFWFDGAFNDYHPVRRFPLSYSLQVGYNIPLSELFRSDEIENIRGGALIYPAVGFLFPSRHGSTLRIDFGYKIQHFSKEFTPAWWGTFRTRDAITLRSFTVRAGYVF